MNEPPNAERPNQETYLLARLKKMARLRPSLDTLGEDLFPIGFKMNEFIEITGDTCTGKTFLLLDIVSRCILPSQYNGKEACVIFFNLDHKFSIVHFMKVLEKCMIDCTKNTETEFLDGEMQSVITNSLKRLKMYNCYSEEEFNLSLINLDQHLFNDFSISLIAIDSINSFYWLESDMVRSFRLQNRKPTENINKCYLKIDTHYERIIGKLKKISNEYKISILFTEDEHYAKKHRKSLINFKFDLSKLNQIKDSTDAPTEYKMSLNHMENNFLRHYHIKENGINILSNK